MYKIFKDTRVREYIEKSLLPGIKNRQVVDYEYIISIWNEVSTITTCMDSRLQVLWTVFSFEIWAQMYLENKVLIHNT